MKRRDPPASEEVIAKLKDDGDFDALRLKIVRKVKENDDLRNSIVMEVKQSVVLNEDGSENLKPRQLSDSIYQELGSKIMGQISDEVWKVIRSNDTIKDEIRGTVEAIYRRLVNPEVKREDQVHSSPVKERLNSGKEDNVPLVTASKCEKNVPDGGEPNEPPGFAPCEQQASNGIMVEHKEPACDQQLCLPSKEELHQPPDVSHPSDANPPGFVPGGNSAELQDGVSDEDPDVPPGFG